MLTVFLCAMFLFTVWIEQHYLSYPVAVFFPPLFAALGSALVYHTWWPFVFLTVWCVANLLILLLTPVAGSRAFISLVGMLLCSVPTFGWSTLRVIVFVGLITASIQSVSGGSFAQARTFIRGVYLAGGRVVGVMRAFSSYAPLEVGKATREDTYLLALIGVAAFLLVPLFY